MITSIKKFFRRPGDDQARLKLAVPASAQVAANFDDLPQTQKFQLHEKMELRDDGQTQILIDNRSGTITTCNETAWTILNLLKSAVEPEDVCRKLVELYQVTQAHAEQDTRSFLKYLGDLGYLQESH